MYALIIPYSPILRDQVRQLGAKLRALSVIDPLFESATPEADVVQAKEQ